MTQLEMETTPGKFKVELRARTREEKPRREKMNSPGEEEKRDPGRTTESREKDEMRDGEVPRLNALTVESVLKVGRRLSTATLDRVSGGS